MAARTPDSEIEDQPGVSSSAGEIRRVRVGLLTFAGLLLLANLVAGGVDTAQTLLLLACAGIYLIAAIRINANNLQPWVFGTALTLLVLTVPAALRQVTPQAIMLGPLIVVSMALPYVRGVWLSVLCGLAVCVNAANVSISILQLGRTQGAAPSPIAQIVMLSAFFALVVMLLRVFSRRLNELRDLERARAERERDLRAVLGRVLEASPVAISVCDGAGKIQHWNPACERLFGLTRDAAMGQPLQTLLAGDRRAMLLADRLFEEHRVSLAEVCIGKSEDELVSVEVAAAAVRQGEEVLAYVGLAVDVALRHKLEQAYVRAQRLESAGLIASGIVHDLNNLLMVVSAETTLILDEELSTDAARSAASIQDAAESAADLCRRLLDATRGAPAKPEIVDLRVLLRDMTRLLGRLLGGLNEAVIEASDQECKVRIDRGQFEQLMMNLAVNARDAMPSGGRFTVRVRAEGEQVLLEVADSGIGMSPEIRARAFDPLFSTKGESGTGLGLATIERVVRTCGGEITLESELGQGSTFRIRLPRQTSDDDPTQTATARRALLVDDDATIRRVVERVLRRRGWDVCAMDGPTAALAFLESGEQVDVLISDVVMPQMNGWELAQRVRERFPALPTLLISGYTADAAIEPAIAAGEVEFLPKPFTIDELTQAVARTVRSRS